MATLKRTYSLPVPLLRSLDGEVRPGQCVFVKGFVLGDSFVVCLTTGPDIDTHDITNGDDVALYAKFQVKEKHLITNSMLHGSLGKETKTKLRMNIDEEFDVRIRAHEEYFEVFANGKPLCNFGYRAPLTKVNHIYIGGLVDLYQVSWEGRYYSIPFQSSISMLPGNTIFIAGYCGPNAKRFNINLMYGSEHAFHFDVRFNSTIVVRNHSTEAHGWHDEERDGGFPFKKDQTFDITVGCTATGYQVYINGMPFTTFKHRIDNAKVDRLLIEGDVTIHGMHW